MTWTAGETISRKAGKQVSPTSGVLPGDCQTYRLTFSKKVYILPIPRSTNKQPPSQDYLKERNEDDFTDSKELLSRLPFPEPKHRKAPQKSEEKPQAASHLQIFKEIELNPELENIETQDLEVCRQQTQQEYQNKYSFIKNSTRRDANIDDDCLTYWKWPIDWHDLG